MSVQTNLNVQTSPERVSKRIDGKVVKGYVVDGVFYRTKKEAGLSREQHKQHKRGADRKQHTQRSDKKPVSQNNVTVVALKLLQQYEVPLVTMLEATYQDTKDAAVLEQLQLIGATKDALSELVFLAGFCHPSKQFYEEKTVLALQLAYKFIIQFFPDELKNVDNRVLGTFRPRRVHTECACMDDGEEGTQFRFTDAATVDAVQL